MSSGEKNLAKALYKGASVPMTRVILRLIPIVLLVAAIAIFVTAIMRFNELEREREALEEKIEEYEYEIEELHYLIDSPVDYDYIVRVAREKLGLHLPDEIVYYNDYNGSK
jgi:cell division protein FtsB